MTQEAKKFVEFWTYQRGSEKGEDQKFWNSLLSDVLGVADVTTFIQYQVPVHAGGTTKFLDALRAELAAARAEPNLRKREAALVAFQERLGSLRFLDPACGSGNFLTETYISLRKLENEALALRFKGQGRLDLGDDRLVHVSISQFHGIEVNDFAVTVAQTAMWIAECKMMQETNAILAKNFTPLPLTDSARIFEGNALRMDWGETIGELANWRIGESWERGHAGRMTLPDGESVGRDVLGAPPHFDYIMGNPPFVGGKLMSASQKEDMLLIFGKKWKNLGNMDYVSCWYKKAAEKAHVHCVIVGFHVGEISE